MCPTLWRRGIFNGSQPTVSDSISGRIGNFNLSLRLELGAQLQSLVSVTNIPDLKSQSCSAHDMEKCLLLIAIRTSDEEV